MAAFIEETGRSFPNPISGAAYDKPFKRPSSGKYRTHSKYPDPGTSRDYVITFDGQGPGSRPLGTDVVHYIGQERTANCAPGTCDKVRTAIYRFYRPNKVDHNYSNEPELQKEDAGVDNENWEYVLDGYNKEPRKGVPVFFGMHKQVTGSVPLNKYYSYWPDNTQLTTGNNTPTLRGSTSGVGNGQNLYKFIKVLCYIFETESAASAYQEGGNSQDPIVPLYHYSYLKGSGDRGNKIDDFYTIDPYNEINITGGPIASRYDGNDDWEYQGIIGYVFTKTSPQAPVESYIDGSKIGPTGQCIDRSGWYAYDDNNFGSGRYASNSRSYSYDNYRQFDPASYGLFNGPNPGTPGVSGWGNGTDGVQILDADANFEWFYGLSGAVKASVPRYLGFEDSYDTQFMYYLYDTTYPWNGPVFSCQYTLNDVPCCPNGTDEDGDPTCSPNLSYHSHFYEIKESMWNTTETTIKINDGQEDANACFYEVDTNQQRILFRYTNNDGTRFEKGQALNGWDINAAYYFGDELKCGLLELVGDGNDFTAGGSITSETGATAVVLAGRGIPNKAAFCGVYEFQKRISFYKVEIDPRSLIPHRTLDQAVLKAKINKKGEVASIDIVNAGTGYKDPLIKVINPRILEDFSANDTSKHVKKHQVKQNPDWQQSIPTPDASDSMMSHVENNYGFFDIRHKGKKGMSKNNDKQIYREAEIEITKLSKTGSIKAIRIIDPGSGYNQSDQPEVTVVDPEYFEFKSPAIDNTKKLFSRDNKNIKAKDYRFDEMGIDIASAFLNTEIPDLQDQDEGTNQSFINQSFGVITQGLEVQIPDSYIRIAEESKTDTTKHCFNLPTKCINIDARGNIAAALPGDDEFSLVTQVNEGVAEFSKTVMPYAYSAVTQVDQFNSNISHVYGAFGKENCITTGQPKLYNISRWFDMPCPYLDASTRNENLPNVTKKARKGEKLLDNDDKAFGWLPYKYCASDQSEAAFTVSLEIKGKTTGSQGDDFMRFLRGMQKPELARSRKVKPLGQGNNDTRVWDCNDGQVAGRCYRDPNDDDEIIFIPIGGDENTYDYNTTGGLSEVDQLRLWMGDNVGPGGVVSGSGYWTWSTSTTDADGNTTTTNNQSAAVPYNYLDVDCPSGNNYPKHECWDTYANSSGPLNVYCGYDSNGNGIAGERWWEITGPNGVVNPWCNSCPPPTSYTGYTFFGFGQSLGIACALTFVNDCAIAIQPERIDRGTLTMRMGPYDGKMKVRNWLTGSTIALGRALRNTGNPFFDECSEELIVGRPYQVGQQINEGV